MMPLRFTFVLPDMGWLLDYKANFPLGILYVASAIESRGHSVVLFDSNKDTIDSIWRSDVFCFSAVHTTYQSCESLALKIKELYPGSKIIIGGVCPTLSPEMIDSVFDSVFIGQAENTIQEYINELENGTERRFYTQIEDVNINNLLPAREWLPCEYIKTKSIFSGGLELVSGGSTSIMFSRGCPFDCAFCSSSAFYKRRMKFRSVESIHQEVQYLKNQFGIHQYRVQDDTFTLNKKFFFSLSEMLQKENIFYRCSTRVDVLDEDIVDVLWKSGCREVGLGIEVADNDVLLALHKGISIETAYQGITLLRKYPFFIRLFFLTGLPFDSNKLTEANITFIQKAKPDSVVVGNFVPFPGSDMFEQKEKYGISSINNQTCMNISSECSPKPNIVRKDINTERHCEIMKGFYDFLKSERYI